MTPTEVITNRARVLIRFPSIPTNNKQQKKRYFFETKSSRSKVMNGRCLFTLKAIKGINTHSSILLCSIISFSFRLCGCNGIDRILYTHYRMFSFILFGCCYTNHGQFTISQRGQNMGICGSYHNSLNWYMQWNVEHGLQSEIRYSFDMIYCANK